MEPFGNILKFTFLCQKSQIIFIFLFFILLSILCAELATAKLNLTKAAASSKIVSAGGVLPNFFLLTNSVAKGNL